MKQQKIDENLTLFEITNRRNPTVYKIGREYIPEIKGFVNVKGHVRFGKITKS